MRLGRRIGAPAVVVLALACLTGCAPLPALPPSPGGGTEPTTSETTSSTSTSTTLTEGAPSTTSSTPTSSTETSSETTSTTATEPQQETTSTTAAEAQPETTATTATEAAPTTTTAVTETAPAQTTSTTVSEVAPSTTTTTVTEAAPAETTVTASQTSTTISTPTTTATTSQTSTTTTQPPTSGTATTTTRTSTTTAPGTTRTTTTATTSATTTTRTSTAPGTTTSTTTSTGGAHSGETKPAPQNTVLPQISGAAVTGDILRAGAGQWSGAPTSYDYQWLACEPLGPCVELPGATASTYTPLPAEIGFTLRVLVTATGATGSARALSLETAPVAEPSSAPTSATDCIDSLAACGYPDASSTNVGPGAACSSLKPSGGLTIGKAGTTVEGLDITGEVVVEASDVTLTHDCVSADGGGASGSRAVRIEDGAKGTQIDYSDISGANSSSESVEEAVSTNYGDAGTVIDHDYIFNCGECVHGSAILTNSYVTANASINPGQADEDHYEDIYYGGGGGPLVVDHDTLLNPHDQTAAVFVSVDFGDITTLTITDNLMAGGDYVLYGGGSGGGGAVLGPVTVTGNRFSRLYAEQGGTYGVGAYFDDAVTLWSGNVWDETLEEVPGP
jgi:hypothetical protein